jgi:hypothetical protein
MFFSSLVMQCFSQALPLGFNISGLIQHYVSFQIALVLFCMNMKILNALDILSPVQCYWIPSWFFHIFLSNIFKDICANIPPAAQGYYFPG